MQIWPIRIGSCYTHVLQKGFSLFVVPVEKEVDGEKDTVMENRHGFQGR